MQLLDAHLTRTLLPIPALIDMLASAVGELADGRIACPERLVVPMPSGVLLSMPAVAADITVHKLISVLPGNAQRGLPAIQGHLTVIDSASGTPRLLLDGPTVTGRRTAAISLLGLRALHRAAPRHVLLIGAGTQASHHLDALAQVYPGLRVTVRARSAASASRLVQSHAGSGLVLAGAPATPANRAGEHADPVPDDVDVVITCTTSREPIYREAAREGRLVIAVGAFQADAAEIDAATVRASQIVVDDPAGARHEAGDLIRAGVAWDGVQALDAWTRSAAHPCRAGHDRSRPILFKSVGCAAWDLAAARLALCQAQ